MLILIAVVLVLIAAGMMIGRKACWILIAVLWAAAHWGTPAQAAVTQAQETAALDADAAIMSKYVDMGKLMSRDDRVVIGYIEYYDHVRTGWAKMYMSLAVSAGMGTQGFGSYERALRKTPGLCIAGRRLAREGAHISVVVKNADLPKDIKNLIEFCFTDELVNVIKQRVDY